MNADAARWQPTAEIHVLRQRAAALAAAREFFATRNVLETETPHLVEHPVSEPQLANVRCSLAVRPARRYYLHTSPEYHMKRLLAAGAPDIYQISKVFRDGEFGPRHLPEFTLVEWYRRNITLDDMIGEACDLVRTIGLRLGRHIGTPNRHDYRELFIRFAGIDPLAADTPAVRDRALQLLPAEDGKDLAHSLQDDRSAWLDLLMVRIIEPALRPSGLTVIERYPAEQAALARRDPRNPALAARFEIYLDGLELANGYHELANAREQRLRFDADRVRRRSLGLPDVEPDMALLAALESGLPNCCGTALGFDRLLMACLGIERISRVVSFTIPSDD
ncbi:MAG: EF-P lysine aminoacylase EpmA [Gammaproteobacteria bacterium]|nr:MAG: EF-P lysine aminoacylase EpmA [Gammaproteobacteria bacterium]